MPNPKHTRRLLLASICVAIAFVQGWILLKMAPGLLVYGLLFLGIVGGIPFMLVSGVHGDTEGAAGVIGGFLYVVVNGAVYYGLITLITKVMGRLYSKKPT